MSIPLDRIREGMRVRATYATPGAGIDWTGTALQTASLGAMICLAFSGAATVVVWIIAAMTGAL